MSQKDRLAARLAERKRSRAMRATSQNQTLPLNFDNNQSKLIEDGPNDISLNSVQVHTVQTSAMSGPSMSANQHTK